MPDVMRNARKSIATLLAMLVFSCAGGAEPANPPQQISLSLSPDLPVDFRAEVDIVFVYDRNLLNRLPFTQFDWMSGRDEFLDDPFLELDIIQLELQAGMEPPVVALPERHAEAIGVLVFASHEDPVEAGIDITDESRIVLQILDYGINVITN